MSPLRKLELAWKYRRPLWKYRKLIRYRKQILFAAAVGAGVIAAVCVPKYRQSRLLDPGPRP
jgi:hypothetical protein